MLMGLVDSFSPQKFREIVFLLIYSQDFGGDVDVPEMIMAQLSVTKRIVRNAQEVLQRFSENKAAIDAVIEARSQAYELDRIPRVERNIVRLGVYELLFVPDVPPKVVIAEAMRLARKFATKEAATFVNALMDSVYHSLGKEGACHDRADHATV